MRSKDRVGHGGTVPEEAGLSEPACRGRGLARHTFATELAAVAGIDSASQALGHVDLITTLAIYGHQDDLEAAMETYARWLEQQGADR